ncbi:MAG: prepilin-type N-terminal cleavage/methylation domain-containing protein [Proteobacteria bacterium]|nr:prepilin-type N-terminal cleavage/methylation domain-containing protein [Pseudomonadota bacterium]NBP12805.1 prepilin-type N-terminal cleavage/methylation domain-containing protein [bacterium]
MNNKGYTITELLVAIFIISFLIMIFIGIPATIIHFIHKFW